jgi:hypothetical protein
MTSGRAARPTLSATVLRLAAVALVAAVLVWSVLVSSALSERSDAVSGANGSTAQHAAASPQPVTTRTS